MMTCFKETKLVEVLNWIPGIKRIKPIDIDKYTIASKNKYPFYGQQLKNNGIVDYISVDEKYLNNKHNAVYLLIASNNHSINIVTTPFFLKEDHAATSIIGHDKMTRLSALYIKGSIQSVFDTSFDYNAKALQGVLQNTYVTLPFTSENSKELDWGYMESKIKQIEEKQIRYIDNYLKKLGYTYRQDMNINNYDKEIINTYSKASFKEYSINQLFEIKSPKKKFNAQDIEFTNDGFYYVARSNENNGVKGRTKQDIIFLNNGNTISFGQDTATIFYQPKPYFTGDKMKILTPMFKGFNSKNAQYFITTMRKAFSNFSWGSTSFNVNILNNVKIKLPINKKGELDLHIMEEYIKVIEKKCLIQLKDNIDKRLSVID